MGVCFTLVECYGYFKREKDGGDIQMVGILVSYALPVALVFFEC